MSHCMCFQDVQGARWLLSEYCEISVTPLEDTIPLPGLFLVGGLAPVLLPGVGVPLEDGRDARAAAARHLPRVATLDTGRGHVSG